MKAFQNTLRNTRVKRTKSETHKGGSNAGRTERASSISGTSFTCEVLKLYVLRWVYIFFYDMLVFLDIYVYSVPVTVTEVR